jgi:hypothetical protein
VNLKLADPVHDWLIDEGKTCHSHEDVDRAAARFMKRWPGIQPEVLEYVSTMLRAQLHPRTFRPSQIIDGVGKRMALRPHLPHRWWQPGSM